MGGPCHCATPSGGFGAVHERRLSAQRTCRGLFLPFWLLRLIQVQLDHCPTRHRKRAALILVAVDIEPGLVLSSSPVFADVLLALDLYDRTQWQKRRTGDGVAPAANVR